jgi:hypothetical protein
MEIFMLEGIARARHLLVSSIALLGAAATPCLAQDRSIGEFIVLPSVTNQARYHGGLNGELSERVLTSEIDFFATAEAHGLSFLGELLVEDHPEEGTGAELERFQIGALLGANAHLWLGRFHNPIGYWNTQHHHGRYMEIPVTRPGFLNYEEQSGVLPMHLAGLLLDGRHAHGDGAVRYSIAAGAAPELSSGGLRAVDILRPRHTQTGLATTLRIEYQPDEESNTLYSAFASQAHIYNDVDTAGDIDQRISGIAANWQAEQLHLIGAAFHVENDFANGDSHSHFLYAYAQADYQWAPSWNAYARVLGNSNVPDDPYLAYFETVYKEQDIVGVRFDFKTHQALKVELGHVRLVGEDYDEIGLQWSAAFP